MFTLTAVVSRFTNIIAPMVTELQAPIPIASVILVSSLTLVALICLREELDTQTFYEKLRQESE